MATTLSPWREYVKGAFSAHRLPDVTAVVLRKNVRRNAGTNVYDDSPPTLPAAAIPLKQDIKQLSQQVASGLQNISNEQYLMVCFVEKTKLIARWGRKATGLHETAGLPA